ncbi:Hypothetical protein PBC10988_1360 [Planctomycetales bacterium 10988]|nr:Hypothetical protein PBC10988_1360 [Planctomycetales bacterium 10988]
MRSISSERRDFGPGVCLLYLGLLYLGASALHGQTPSTPKKAPVPLNQFPSGVSADRLVPETAPTPVQLTSGEVAEGEASQIKQTSPTANSTRRTDLFVEKFLKRRAEMSQPSIPSQTPATPSQASTRATQPAEAATSTTRSPIRQAQRTQPWTPPVYSPNGYDLPSPLPIGEEMEAIEQSTRPAPQESTPPTATPQPVEQMLPTPQAVESSRKAPAFEEINDPAPVQQPQTIAVPEQKSTPSVETFPVELNMEQEATVKPSPVSPALPMPTSEAAPAESTPIVESNTQSSPMIRPRYSSPVIGPSSTPQTRPQPEPQAATSAPTSEIREEKSPEEIELLHRLFPTQSEINSQKTRLRLKTPEASTPETPAPAMREPIQRREPARVSTRPTTELTPQIKPHPDSQVSRPISGSPLQLRIKTNSIPAGKVVDLEMVVKNTSAGMIPFAKVDLALPQGIQLHDDEKEFSKEGLITWHFEGLRSGEERSFQLSVQTQDPGKFSLPVQLYVGTLETIDIEVVATEVDLTLSAPNPWPTTAPANFQITLNNDSSLAYENVSVVVQLPPLFRTATQTDLTFHLPKLDRGQTAGWTLPLEAVRSGRTQVTVQVWEGDRLLTEAFEEVQIQGEEIEISAFGPTAHPVDEVGLYAAELSNSGAKTVDELVVWVSPDKNIQVIDAEEGVEVDQENNYIGWMLNNLPPGKRQVIRWWAVGKQEGHHQTQVNLAVNPQGENPKTYQETIHTEHYSARNYFVHLESIEPTVELGKEMTVRLKVISLASETPQSLLLEATWSEQLTPISNELGSLRSDNLQAVQIPVVLNKPNQLELIQWRAKATSIGEAKVQIKVRDQQSGEVLEELEKTLVVRSTRQARWR